MNGRASRPSRAQVEFVMRRDHGRTLFSLSLSLHLSHLPSIQLLLPTENRYKERERIRRSLLSVEILRIFPIRYPPLRYVKAFGWGGGEVSFPSSLCSLFLGRHFLRSNDHHRRPRYREIIRKICPLSADPRQPPQLPSLFLPNGQEIGQESSLSTLSMLDHRLL